MVRKLAIGAVAAGLLALPAGAWAQDPAFYCDGTADNGASGALTDSEHSVLVGDPALPKGARQRRVTVDGVTTTVTEAGPRKATQAVVFAHGSPEYSRDFDGLLAGAGRNGRAISFDWPGYGHADDRAGGPYTADGAAHFFAGLMAQLGVRKVDLVMHDLGGPWALQWAVSDPAALHSVVAIDSGVFLGYQGHLAALGYVTPGVGEADMAAETRESFKAPVQAQNPRPLPNVFLDRMYDNYDRGTRCALLHYYRDMRDRGPDTLAQKQTAVLKQRTRPALVVWGEKDPYIPVDVAYRQSQAFPGARVQVIKDAGHWPFVDDPAQVDRIVLPFLRSVQPHPRPRHRTHRHRHRHRR